MTRLTFDALNAGWDAEITRAYRDLDLPLSPEALTAMRTVIKANGKGKHRHHSEQLARFAAQG